MNLEEIKITPLLDSLRLEKIDDSIYFSEKYKNYISNSRLNLIDPRKGGSPSDFFAGFKSTFNTSFKLGTGVHCLTLQSDLFTICDEVDEPTAKVGALANRLYKTYLKREITPDDIIKESLEIDYYSGLLNDSKIQNVLEKCRPYWESRKQFESAYVEGKEILYFDPKSREVVYNCVRALKNNGQVQKLLHPESLITPVISEYEQAVLLDILVEIPKENVKFKLRIKSKLDNYTIDSDLNVLTVNDVKTIGRIVSEAEVNIQRFSYNREIALYSWLLSLCAKKFYGISNSTIKGNYLFVSTIPKYYTKVIPMTKQMYSEGWNEFVYLLKLVAISVYKDYPDFGIWN